MPCRRFKACVAKCEPNANVSQIIAYDMDLAKAEEWRLDSFAG